VLLLIAGFRMPGYLTSTMAMPLFKHLKLTEHEIVLVTKTFGFVIALLATMFSAYIIRRIGILRALLLGTAAGSASHLALAWLAAHGNEFWAFCLAVSIEGFAYAFAQMVLITFMSLIVSKENAASQFALLTSLCALPGSLLSGSSGFVVEYAGFVNFFVGAALVGIPVALLAWWLARQGLPALEEGSGPTSA
jgi:PAT family beta-lactamase induction signal transducer AmpG